MKLRLAAHWLVTAATAGVVSATGTAAHASASTPQALSPEMLSSALSSVAEATATHERQGWTQEESFGRGSDTSAYDPKSGTTMTREELGGTVYDETSSNGRLIWKPISSNGTANAALKLLERPDARYTQERGSLKLPSPSAGLRDRLEEFIAETQDGGGVLTAASSTEEGVTTYVATVAQKDGDGDESERLSVRTDAKGALLSMTTTTTASTYSYSRTSSVTYGRPSIRLPAYAVVVWKARFDVAAAAVRLPNTIRAVASDIAEGREMDGRSPRVTAADIRVAAAERRSSMPAPLEFAATMKIIRGGVSIQATHPWTKRTYACEVVAIKNRAQVRNCDWRR